MKVFPVHHSSCKVVCYFLSFDLDRLGDLEKDPDGLRFLSWDSDLSLLLYLLKGPAPAAGEASPSWRSVARGRTPPPIIISRATTPKKKAATISTSPFPIRQVHSYSAATECSPVYFSDSNRCISGNLHFQQERSREGF